MAVLTKQVRSGGHWYHPDGTPAHRMPKANGDGDRATTKRDAKRLGLYPSVTGKLSIMAKPGLEKWKLNQVAMATQRTPQNENESDDYWCNRVRNAAFEQVEEAADLGSEIHAALELAMNDEEYDPKMRVYVEPVVAWKVETGIEIVEREIVVVNKEHGFAGTADVIFRYGKDGIGILDYKTRKTKPGVKVKAYDNQALQLAAYGATYWGEENIGRILAANLFISRTEPGRFDPITHKSMAEDWEAFKLIAALWRYVKGYDPRKGAQ